MIALQETIHLTRLVQAALKVKQAHEDSFGSFKKIEHLPIFGMTKEKAMAIRYNLPDDRVRCTRIAICLRGHNPVDLYLCSPGEHR